MREKLGVTATWALYLGIVRLTGREGSIFVVYVLAMALVMALCIRHLMHKERT